MEIVDELNTPGCPQCAVKHLCAALSYAADHNQGDEQMGDEFVLAARALINLAEADVGYKSHRDFAVGLLERAEQRWLTFGYDVLDAERFRNLRLAIVSGDRDAEADARVMVDKLLHPTSYMWAHLVEANRELPMMHIPTNDPSVETIQALLKAVREEFFDLPPSTVPGEGETTQTEKEPDMATAKKTTPAKGAKCAAKGGKTAKATKCACKGGKAKK